MFKIIKAKRTAIICAIMCMAITICAYAEGTADASVTSAFTTIADNIKATMGTIATVGVGILGVFLAWKYGKKLFNRVAN